jgi:hypothetical protein
MTVSGPSKPRILSIMLLGHNQRSRKNFHSSEIK